MMALTQRSFPAVLRLTRLSAWFPNMGSGALMAKFDVEAAYHNIAVHPDDCFLPGLKWQGKYFVDLALPFGLRSALYIFNSVADMVEWILLHRYHLSDLLHYLDDFFTAGPPNSDQCAVNLQTALSVCRSWAFHSTLASVLARLPSLWCWALSWTLWSSTHVSLRINWWY